MNKCEVKGLYKEQRGKLKSSIFMQLSSNIRLAYNEVFLNPAWNKSVSGDFNFPLRF